MPNCLYQNNGYSCNVLISVFGQFLHKCSQDICNGPNSVLVAMVIVIKSVKSFDINWSESICSGGTLLTLLFHSYGE